MGRMGGKTQKKGKKGKQSGKLVVNHPLSCRSSFRDLGRLGGGGWGGGGGGGGWGGAKKKKDRRGKGPRSGSTSVERVG